MKRLSRSSIALRAARSVLFALLASSCAALPLPASAGAYTFSNPNAQRTVNAGVVLLDSTTNQANTATIAAGPDNPDPYAFYILSRRVDLLPVGWTIKNPLASHNVAADVQARWDARTSNSTVGTTFVNNNGGHAYQFGQNLTPGMAAYWEVSMNDASTQDLQQFDVLLVNLANNDVAKFRPSEVEKLRRFVDGGGTLLVEDASGGRITTGMGTAGTTNAYGPLFFPLQFASSASGTAQLSSLAYRHPILSAPYYLAQNELNALGNGFTGDYVSNAGTDFASILADTNSKPVIAVNTYGAGAVVVSSTGTIAAINNTVTAGSIPTTYGPNSGPYCGTNFQASPTQDLKFLCNIISWVGGHSHEHQNSHQTGETLSALPSAVRSWNYTATSAANVPGATINGNFIYSMDSAGTLHAFDLYPYEDLDGDGRPDDGIADYSSKGTAYDEVWNVGTARGSSAATVATPPGSNAFVFIEQPNGTIKSYQASASRAIIGTTLTPPTAPGTFATGGNAPPAPAPTYYEGRLYASEPDGSLFIKDFGASTTGTPRSAASGVSVKLDAVTATVVPTGAPTVGALASPGSDTGTLPQATDIVAMVPTNNGLYSLFLGARGETLKGNASPFTAGHVPTGGAIDANAPYRAYSLAPATPPANGYATNETANLTPMGTTFSGTPTNTPLFADYDVDFAKSTSLTRTIVTLGGNAGVGGVCSTPALDRFGNAYYFASEPSMASYTVLTSLHDATSGPLLPWRFRLPDVGENITDADGTNYTALEGFQFQGKPVVDSQGFVYALASKTTNGSGQTAILCFDPKITITTTPLAADVGSTSLTQVNPATNVSEFGASSGSTTLFGSQYSQGSPGDPLTIRSFGATTGSTPAMLAPNLNEPEPITVTTNQAATTNGGVLQLALHTNLVWYSIVETNVVPPPASAAPGTLATGTNIAVTPGEGLTKVGNALFFVGQASGSATYNLFSVPADPQTAGYAITNKVIATNDMAATTSRPAYVTDSGDTGVGGTSAVASAANGALIVNGTNGVSAFLNRTTLVTDNSRVMELNQDGSAAWLADSTQGNIGLGTTSLELSRPSSITELTPNDYLVADTGNNRAVRFDRAGKVVWELTRFADTQDPLSTANYGKTGPLLSASEPNTLNQPTSVQIRQSVEYVGAIPYTVVHYLVSDTGNFRILDIVDVYDANGTPVGTPHNLVWISHTHDKQQRQYRYQSAAYFNAPDVPGTGGATVKHPTFIVALVTNQRVAQPPANPALGALASSAQDAPGGSLVLLDYDPINAYATQKNGYIATIIDHVQAYLKNTAAAGQPPVYAFDLATALANAGAPSPSFTGGTPTTLYIRNPRYLKAYTPTGPNAFTGPNALPNLLLADDNGVFDLIYDSAGSQQYFTQWGFTQADYQAQGNNPVKSTVPYNRGIIPFVPQSIQRTATDQVVDSSGTPHSIGRYLVTNGYSKGDPSNLVDPNAFGGEVFELDVALTGGVLETNIINTLGRISNSSPLVQPTFAYRLQ